jgi:hypothetical protein
VVVTAGYDAAFLSLGALAGAGFILYLIAMPETAAASWPRVCGYQRKV